MSIDQNLDTVIGFKFTVKALKPIFGVPVPEKFHLEPRFDEKTGRKLPDKRVVDDDARTDWRVPRVLNASDVFASSVMEEVATEVRKRLRKVDPQLAKDVTLAATSGEDDEDQAFVFGIDFGEIQDAGGRCMDGHIELTLGEVGEIFSRVQKIGDVLNDLGFPIATTPTKLHVLAYTT